MVDCTICRYFSDNCSDCRHGENFERVTCSPPLKVSVREGIEYCAHCGYVANAEGLRKFYCLRCGGLNLRYYGGTTYGNDRMG